jgi:DNA-binding response OmpR family regulator
MPRTILVVAREAGVRHLLSSVLTDDGYYVITEVNSEVALTIVEHEQLDLIVADVPTPTVDRRDFFQTLATLRCPVPVVVMATANAALIARLTSAAGNLEQPFTVFQARATIRAAIMTGNGAALPAINAPKPENALRAFVYTNQRFLAEMIKMTLDHGVFVARASDDVDEAMEIIRDWPPQLIVIDLDTDNGVMLHRIALARGINARLPPLLGVSRSRDLQTTLAAFENGVDDILTVPISPQELLVRVLALMRRTYGQTIPLKPILLHGALTIDIVKHLVTVGRASVDLTSTEESMLYLLAANAGEVISNQEILATIWGTKNLSEKRILERTIASLRKKLQSGGATLKFIDSFPKVGHRFLPVDEQSIGLS